MTSRAHTAADGTSRRHGRRPHYGGSSRWRRCIFSRRGRRVCMLGSRCGYGVLKLVRYSPLRTTSCRSQNPAVVEPTATSQASQRHFFSCCTGAQDHYALHSPDTWSHGVENRGSLSASYAYSATPKTPAGETLQIPQTGGTLIGQVRPNSREGRRNDRNSGRGPASITRGNGPRSPGCRETSGPGGDACDVQGGRGAPGAARWRSCRWARRGSRHLSCFVPCLSRPEYSRPRAGVSLAPRRLGDRRNTAAGHSHGDLSRPSANRTPDRYAPGRDLRVRRSRPALRTCVLGPPHSVHPARCRTGPEHASWRSRLYSATL